MKKRNSARVNVEVDRSFHKKFKAECVRNGITMKHVLIGLMGLYLKGKISRSW